MMKCDIKQAEEGQAITSETVLPCLPEIFVDERRGEYLALNPLGPWWFVGSKLHASFVQLCDGKRSLSDIREVLSGSYDGLTDERMISVAQSLQKANFFTPTVKREINPLNIAFFNITKRCNLSCPYCYYDSVPVKCDAVEEELDAATWIELAGKIAEINPWAKIIISGGEPLIRPDTIQIITEIIARSNLAVKLVTNGTLFTEEIISRLSNIDKFSIQVSIDSIIPEENERTRGKGSLDKALAAVQQLKAAGIDFEISATLTRLNIKTVRQFREYCIQNHYNFRSSIFMLSGETSKKNAGWLELNPEEYLDACTYALEYYDPDTTMGHPMEPGERRYSCGLGYGQVDISPDGSVSPCSHICDSKYQTGNIRTSDLRQLVAEGHRRYSVYDIDRMSHCADVKKCPVRYFCAGGCRANGLHNYGTMDAPAKNCEQLRQSYINALWVSVLGPAYLNQ
jgi:radical SAM protein with 4Fe4S-binding SPASM domain